VSEKNEENLVMKKIKEKCQEHKIINYGKKEVFVM